MSKSAQAIYDQLGPDDRRAVNLVKAILDQHNTKDGVGLFAGVSRYAILESRIRLTAVRSRTLAQWWALTAQQLRLPITKSSSDDLILGLLTGADDAAVLSRLADQTAVIVMVARSLHSEQKDERRAAKAALYGDRPDYDPPSPAVPDDLDDRQPLMF